MRPLAIAALAISTNICIQPAFAQTGWTGTVTTLSAPALYEGGYPELRIAVEPDGNAYAVWTQLQGRDNMLVQMARYTQATDSWSAPTTLAGPGEFSSPDVAVDGLGNAFFAFTRHTPMSNGAIDIIRFAPGSGSLNVATLSSSVTDDDEAQVVADASGGATVVFTQNTALRSARYSAATGTWTNPIAAAGHGLLEFQVKADPAGNVTAVWWTQLVANGTFIVQSARLGTTSLVWSDAVNLSLPAGFGGFSTGLALAVDPVGNATAAWATGTNGLIIHAARFHASSGTWTTATDVSAPGADLPNAATDPSGNVALVWVGTRATRPGDDCARILCNSFIQAALFSAATSSWSAPVDLSSPNALGAFGFFSPQVRFDAVGNAVVVWGRAFGSSPFNNSDIRIQAARFTAATNSVSLTDLSAPGQLAFNPDLAFDASGNATVAWFHPTSYLLPAATTIQSTRWGNTSPVAPEPPTDLIVSSIDGNTVTLAWIAAGTGADATGYVLEGGVAAGDVLASMPTGGAATTFTFVAPSGVFFARVHAVRGGARSAASNEVRLVVNSPQGPSPPKALLGLVNASTLALSWTNTFGGGVPTSVLVNVTGALTQSVSLGMAETFAFTPVPAGTYTFTVTASNASGVSPPSNAVTLTFPGAACSASPDVPTHVSIVTRGTTVDVTWMPPVAGGAVTGYSLFVSGAFVGSVSTTERAMSGTLAPGTYGLSVVAMNPCGTSPPTPAQTVAVH